MKEITEQEVRHLINELHTLWKEMIIMQTNYKFNNANFTTEKYNELLNNKYVKQYLDNLIRINKGCINITYSLASHLPSNTEHFTCDECSGFMVLVERSVGREYITDAVCTCCDNVYYVTSDGF